MAKYLVTSIEYRTVEDHYEHGEVEDYSYCSGNAGRCYNSIKELMDDISSYLYAGEIYAVDTDGSGGIIWANVLQDGEGISLSKSEIELWKQGKLKAYSTTCTIGFSKLMEVELTDEDKQLIEKHLK